MNEPVAVSRPSLGPDRMPGTISSPSRSWRGTHMATGPTHAISGLLTWSAVTALATDHAIGQLSPRAWVVGAVLSTGAALLPDLDHPQSTVSRTFGSISQGFSSGMNAVSHGIYRLTRTRRDSNRDGGHRGLTHTL